MVRFSFIYEIPFWFVELLFIRVFFFQNPGDLRFQLWNIEYCSRPNDFPHDRKIFVYSNISETDDISPCDIMVRFTKSNRQV